MSKPRPRKKRRAVGEDGAVNHNKFLDEQLDAARHQSSDIRPSPSWTIEPDDKDGLKVHIGSKGRVVLTQHPAFGDQVEIVLHPDEARELLGILPEAIDEADFMRHGGPSFE